ncbi:SUMF1/EgtB/PvdO family nonheme iron enzyme [Bacteroidota bacterium]
MNRFISFRKSKVLFSTGLLLGFVLVFAGNYAVRQTSEDSFCTKCHVHPQATKSWKRSTHYDNRRGIQVHCVDCHLPPKGQGYLKEKTRTGIRDVWGKLFKDVESLNWELKSQPEYAQNHVFEASCVHCHDNNFPLGLSDKGKEAHLYYDQHVGELHCIKCHIAVGHYSADQMHAHNLNFGKETKELKDIYTEPGRMDGFSDFTEYITGSRISFQMVAIPGGTYYMGSPTEEPFRTEDEGPQRQVKLDSFFMARVEVSWDEYLAFFKQTGAQGKTADAFLDKKVAGEVDAISGPTPPWGAPDQGWGKDKMPAIMMTHHAAVVYCQWLTSITGKNYRLPTEAEWEYAARGGTQGAYYFDGNPERFTRTGLRQKLFGVDTSEIASHVIYAINSGGKPARPESSLPNPFGLVNMLGNVAEFCSDYYAPDTYENYGEELLINPLGPATGSEYVIRGGSYRDEANRVRSAARLNTRTKNWKKTDPQIPKSIWWYTDVTYVGFRVVCEYPK